MNNLLCKSIENQEIFDKKNKLLVAVSGGRDSMCLCHALIACGYRFAIAHVNYHFRAQESDDEAELVEKLALDHGLDYYIKGVFLESDISNKQEVARKIRYEFFNEILEQESFDWILTAHHLGDMVETFFINWMRGAGIRGLKSMDIIRDKVVRPFLMIDPSEIESYSIANNVQYLTDSSNLSDHYTRNFFRLNIIPSIEQRFPEFMDAAAKSIMNLKSAYKYLQRQQEKWEKNHVKKTEVSTSIRIPDQHDIYFLLTYLSDQGFHHDTLQDIERNIKNVDARFTSKNNRELRIDETLMYLYNYDNTKVQFNFILECSNGFQLKNDFGNFEITIFDCIPPISTIKSDRYTAYLDAAKLQSSLVVRSWQDGDYIKPIGMKGFAKKLQDIFVDKKVPLYHKQRQMIIENNGEIVWVAGLVFSELYKITDSTMKVVRIKIEPRTYLFLE